MAETTGDRRNTCARSAVGMFERLAFLAGGRRSPPTETSAPNGDAESWPRCKQPRL